MGKLLGGPSGKKLWSVGAGQRMAIPFCTHFCSFKICTCFAIEQKACDYCCKAQHACPLVIKLELLGSWVSNRLLVRVFFTFSLVAKVWNRCLWFLVLLCSEQFSISVLSDWGNAIIPELCCLSQCFHELDQCQPHPSPL